MASIGTAPCRACTREIAIKESDTGTINASCPHCDVTLYAKKNTEGARIILATVKRHKAEDPPAAAATATSSPAPAPAAASGAKTKYPLLR